LLGAGSRSEIRIATGQREPTADFHSTGSLLITRSSYVPTVKLWHVASGREVKLTEDAETSPVAGVFFNLTGTAFAVLKFASPEEKVDVWDVRTLSVTRRLSAGKDFPIYKIELSSDARVLALLRNGGALVKLINLSNGSEIATLSSASNASFSPNGRLLATSSSGDSVSLWDVATGRRVAILENLENVETLGFSADGRTLAMAGRQAPLTLWPTELGTWVESGCKWLEPFLAGHPDRNRYSIVRQDGTRENKLLCRGSPAPGGLSH